MKIERENTSNFSASSRFNFIGRVRSIIFFANVLDIWVEEFRLSDVSLRVWFRRRINIDCFRFQLPSLDIHRMVMFLFGYFHNASFAVEDVGDYFRSAPSTSLQTSSKAKFNHFCRLNEPRNTYFATALPNYARPSHRILHIRILLVHQLNAASLAGRPLQRFWNVNDARKEKRERETELVQSIWPECNDISASIN